MASDDAEEEYDEEAGEDGSDRWDIRLIPGNYVLRNLRLFLYDTLRSGAFVFFLI